MQKLWLKDFEHNISSATWQRAETILETGGVRSLREVEKHFWVALVEDGEERYEIETIITPHKIKAFTCECWSEGRKLICPHIAAGLATVRTYLDKKAAERAAKAEAKGTSENQKFTIQTVLAGAEPADLLAFVREYARRDRDFSIALKTWFATSLEDPAAQFRQLLDSVMPPLAGGKAVKEPDFRRLRKLLDDLQTQAEAARELGNWRTVFSIATVIFQKIAPALARFDEGRRQALLEFCQFSLEQLDFADAQIISPELAADIWKFLFENAEKNLFPPELERSAIQFFAGKAKDADKFSQIDALFDHVPHPAPPFLLHLYLSALATKGMDTACIRVLADYENAEERLRAAVVHLFYMQQWAAAAAVGEHFLAGSTFAQSARREVEDIVLQIAEKQGDRRRLPKLYRERFLRYTRLEFFKKLKTATGEKWPKERQTLFAELAKRGDAKLLASVLAEEEMWPELAEHLAKTASEELFQRHEIQLLAWNRDWLREHYLNFLTEYLENHFGRPAHDHVRQFLGSLVRNDDRPLVQEIGTALCAKFPDRGALAGELAELYPKRRRENF